jgi:hypothetical protein
MKQLLNHPALGWSLAAAAIVTGYFSDGWRGLLLAVTVIVFWLLLQFSRALRVLRAAGQSPVGTVRSAVMLNAKLHAGMKLMDVLALTRSLGHRLSDEHQQPERYVWQDTDGDRVQTSFTAGRLSTWSLHRTSDAPNAGLAADNSPSPPATSPKP